MPKCRDVYEALAPIRSRSKVFVHGAAATPNALLRGVTELASQWEGVDIIHLHTEGPAEYAQAKFAKNIRVVNLFVGANLRDRIDFDHVDYLPCFLSEIPSLFRTGRLSLDVALIHVSSPDKNGYCSLGTSVDVARAAVQSAKAVIAQVNPNMPRVHGDGFIRLQDIDHWIEVDEPLPAVKCPMPTAVELAIGKWVAERIEDGATLQMGIGAIPDAVLASLKNHKDLGIHSEMWSDGALELMESGAVTNNKKKVHPNKTVSSFLIGSKRLYDFVHDNPSVIQLESSYVNDPAVIARNPKVVAINSAVEIDLTGQVCADSVGARIISGVGGQVDFLRGAAMSEGGMPIIAIPSRTKRGKSKIVPQLTPGAGVVTTRGHVHFVATEFGIVDLSGRTLRERAELLISIAHPEDREDLSKSLYMMGSSRMLR